MSPRTQARPSRARARPREPELFFNRELSWLRFNGRVLEEARDRSAPLLERLKFATIAAGNLDEFFMVRVASLQHAIAEGDTAPDPSGMTPAQVLKLVGEEAREMSGALSALLAGEILPGLAERGVRVLGLADLSEGARSALSRQFEAEVLPALTPLGIDASRPFPMLAGLALNLAVLFEPPPWPEDLGPEPDSPDGTDAQAAPEPDAAFLHSAFEGETREDGSPGRADVRLGVVQLPPRFPRFLRPQGVPGAGLVPLEEALRGALGLLFPGQTVRSSALFRITRDSELDLDDEGGDDFLLTMQQELRKRRNSRVVRLEVEASAPEDLVRLLARRLEVDEAEVVRVSGLLDLRPLLAALDLPMLEDLRMPPPRPLPFAELEAGADPFDLLDAGELLLHHPYDSFDPVIRLLDQAADDPDVLAIKQTLYRTSGDSPVVRALSRAAESGKQVTAIVELRARFDEVSNIRWARRLEEAGAHVIYGIRGYKTHAKICLIVRRCRTGVRRYVHLGTGNYNERTARIYTDFGLLTTDPAVGEDASAFFNALTGYSDPPRMKKLVMAPTQLRRRVLDLIGRERRRAEAGAAAEIRAKMNALVDEEIIRALYAASRAGVRIRLNVRGTCCLRPGLKGVSETIEVVSIVDHFLEHARVFHFRNGGDDEVWLSSADWMPRNLDRRIELMFPVESAGARARVLASLDAAFEDNCKARVLGADGAWKLRRPGRGEDTYRSQVRLAESARRARERFRAAAPAGFEPLGPTG